MIRAMELQQVIRLCRAQPEATEGYPFRPGVLVFKVHGKIFAIVMERDEPLRLSLKCEPLLAEALRAEYPAVTGGYHLNKRHWNTVRLDGSVDEERVREWIEDSWDLVVEKLPRNVRRRLRWLVDPDE
jgi:predicted DNA-binding protein (MmcQ/YjbR family)